MTDYAILALTPKGLELARQIRYHLGDGSVIDASGAGAKILRKSFETGRPMICVMALGIVVRALGPHLKDKSKEPPVVVIDETGRFAISVVGGHAGDANKLAAEVAEAIGATPVITTASDLLRLPAVDLIGKNWGWRVDRRENMKRVASAIIKGRPIGVYQDAGRDKWWEEFGPWPHHFHRIDEWPAVNDEFAAVLAITDRKLLPPLNQLADHMLIYRPPSLTLGVGCRRGVGLNEVEDCARELFEMHQLEPRCITALASISLKKDEPALIDFAENREIPFLTYPPNRLKFVGQLPNPSPRVEKLIGIPGVCEPAAMMSAGTLELLVPKTKFKRVTLAVARRPNA